jgi:hypothetical protein
MSKCIFCKSTTSRFTTREHILPESLGGGEWAVLPEGLLCDKCQNFFGSSIEQQALMDYPFSYFRVFAGIPTKKGKPPWFTSWEGTIKASLQPGIVSYEPSRIFKNAVEKERKSSIRLLAHPLKPKMICRFLLKMGLEVVATDNTEVVFDKKFDNARNFALLGEKQQDWWYLQHEDHPAAINYITKGITAQEWVNNIKLETVIVEDDVEVFHLRLMYMNFIVPLESRIHPPPKDSLLEPEYRFFIV